MNKRQRKTTNTNEVRIIWGRQTLAELLGSAKLTKVYLMKTDKRTKTGMRSVDITDMVLTAPIKLKNKANTGLI